jgi:hypothetical protein
MSGLTNGANLTDYGRNGLGVKKILSDGLDVSFNFLVASMSMPSFLMGCMEKSPIHVPLPIYISSQKHACSNMKVYSTGLSTLPTQHHYGKIRVCRASKSLPCVFFRAHGKELICRALL